ncbi:MAG TPA: CDP-glucose 4,6-dehydratase [Candidatus Dormibacteraeota bacterium]|nr:CDP-glucose 4,6-dehydratase [Candidatus Dormibacteraeota bacterium]
MKAWQGRRVFLTGHTGFKGSWLALWLNRRGAKVRGYALDPCTEPNMFKLASVGAVVDDVRGDVRDYAKLETAMTEFAPEVVFHLAAQPIVRRSYADPVGTYTTNVMGTVHLLEAIRKIPSVRAVVCVTTDKCYQNQGWIWPYRESDPLGGHDPYASSKACAEIISAAYRSSFFPIGRLNEHHVGVATARAGNVIGGGDWSEDRLIPDLIRGFCSGQPVLIRRPNAIRPWQHVLESLNGYMILAQELLTQPARFASAYNFGPSDEDVWPVERIANRLVDIWGNGGSWIRDSVPSVHEDHVLRLDASKARVELGWKPRLKIEAALEWTMEWYRAWNQGADMTEHTLEQIAEYERL